jgi:IPT/TIG domain/NHL repeat
MIKTIAVISAVLLFFSCKKNDSPAPVTPPVTPAATTETLGITAISPTSGPDSTLVTITGSDFGTAAAQDSVYFNGHGALVVTGNDSVLTVRVPMRAGTGPVTVKTGGKAVTGPAFTYQYTITSSVFAGSGIINQVNGQGTAASFAYPTGMAMDAAGYLYVGEAASGRIRIVTPSAQVSLSTMGVTSTVDLNSGTHGVQTYQIIGVAIDNSVDELWMSSAWNVITGYTSFQTAPIGGSLVTGTLYDNISPFYQPIALAARGGLLYVANYETNSLQIITNTGTQKLADTLSLLNGPAAMAVDDSANLYIANAGGNDIVKRSASTGTLSVLAGSGTKGNSDGSGTAASFWGPQGIAIDSLGNLYVADSYNGTVRMITPSGTVTTFPVKYIYPIGIVTDPGGDTLFVVDAVGCVIDKISID